MENFLLYDIRADLGSGGKINEIHISCQIAGMNPLSRSLKITQQDYTPKIGDKLFFLPGVNIPRVKVKDLILNYNISISKDINTATVIFGGKNSEAKMVDTKWYYKITTKEFKDCIEALKPHLDIHDYNKINSALEFYTNQYVYSDWNSCSIITDSSLECYRNCIVNPGAAAYLTRTSDYVNLVYPEYYELMENLGDRVIIHEAGLIAKLNNDDSILIDSTVFNQLDNMFKSSDKDNHVIAMEIMANSKYRESLLYIHILFKEHYNSIYNSSTKNHVNFKSLLSYLGKDRYSFQSGLTSIIDSLKDKGVLTIEALDILMQRYSNEIQNGGDQACFKVKSITVNDEIKKLLNVNYDFRVRDEFIPVVQEEVAQKNDDVITPESLTWL